MARIYGYRIKIVARKPINQKSDEDHAGAMAARKELVELLRARGFVVLENEGGFGHAEQKEATGEAA